MKIDLIFFIFCVVSIKSFFLMRTRLDDQSLSIMQLELYLYCAQLDFVFVIETKTRSYTYHFVRYSRLFTLVENKIYFTVSQRSMVISRIHLQK